jgi:hypothetical protein
MLPEETDMDKVYDLIETAADTAGWRPCEGIRDHDSRELEVFVDGAWFAIVITPVKP